MNSTKLDKYNTIRSMKNGSAMFSLTEVDSHYIVAVDIPTIPSTHTEVLSSNGQLTIEGQSEKSEDKNTFFKLFTKRTDIRSIYKDGVLWVLLPKIKNTLSNTKDAIG